MKLPARLKTEQKKLVIYSLAVFFLLVGLVGSFVFWEDPMLSWLFRPGILYLMAIIWGFYLGITYKSQ